MIYSLQRRTCEQLDSIQTLCLNLYMCKKIKQTETYSKQLEEQNAAIPVLLMNHARCVRKTGLQQLVEYNKRKDTNDRNRCSLQPSFIQRNFAVTTVR